MSNEGKAVHRRYTYLLFLGLPLFVFFLLLFILFERSVLQQEALRLQSQQQRGTIIIANQMESAFSQYLSDLLVVHNSNELNEYVKTPSQQSLLDLALLFVRITNQKNYILRQRYIDGSGMELIRVNRKPGNFVSISSTSDLQNLHQTELYLQARNLAPRVLYSSSVTIDGEGNPYITLALPVYQGSRFFGLIALDFDACYMLSFLSDYHESLSNELSFLLVDRNGDVLLRGEDPCSDVNLRDENLFSNQSELQNILSRQTSGTVEMQGAVYTYQAIIASTNEKILWSPGPLRLWTVVSYYDEDQLRLLSDQYLLAHPLLKYFLSFILAVVGSFLAYLYQLRAKDKQQMRISSVIADYSINGIVVCDQEGRITFCNYVFEKMCGLSQDELIGRPSPRVQKDIEIKSNQNEELVQYPAWILHNNGNQYLSAMAIRPIYDRQAKLEHTIEIYSPSRWNVETFITMISSKNHDPSACFRAITPLIEKQRPIACLTFKIQNSKEIGMQLNQTERFELSQALSSTLADLCSSSLPVYSFAFDCYVLFLLDVKPATAVFTTYIENILNYFNEPYRVPNQSLELNMSCGVSLYPSNSQSLAELLANAGLAASMVNEQNSSHRFLFYSKKIKELYQRQTVILKALPSLFSTNQLRLAYQAQLSVASGKITGAEALIRWEHPTLGSVRPDEFLPLLKKLGMIDRLGRFVIVEAIQFLKTHGTNLRSLSPSFSLSINLSAEELGNPALIDLLGAQLREHRIADTLLSVELTEHTAVESFSTANSVLDTLHAQGVSIAIDDFGTGFSSLSYLLELSTDTIKIDRSFISRYPDADSIIMYKTLLVLAKELGAKVLAEGVEKPEELEFLMSIGCDEYQGYYFSPAVDEETFLEQVTEVNT